MSEKRKRKVHPVELKDRLLEAQNHKCPICGDFIGWEVGQGNRHYYPTFEHIIPFGLGGGDGWSNLAVTHRGCNEARK